MGQSDSKHGAGGGAGAGGRGVDHAGNTRLPVGDTERVLLMEVHIARNCLTSFNKMLAAHAIVFALLVAACLMGFLHPPESLSHDNYGHIRRRSKALLIFSLANSLSLYTATSGLLFCLYCNIAAIVSLQSVPLPKRFDDPLSFDLLHNLRASLRLVVLPAVKRRCKFLFSTLAICLTFCMVAYISAGIASIDPSDDLIGVVLPAIPGCFVLLFLLQVTSAKLRLELDFDKRLGKLWSAMAPHIIHPPDIRPLDKATIHALDPLPYFLSWIRDDS